tara:strand:+ start:692 stop:2296 length:1605 start_codon:yes stop_codon:yes gene_type:complete
MSEADFKQPNIVWIVAEDLSEYIPSFGDSTIVTPHLSRLAEEGICYDQFFSPAAVCAPARSAIATGMYPTHLGSNHMRTGPWYVSNVSQQMIDNYAERALPPGLQPYEVILPNGVKMMSEILRENGYYCTNNSKEDYQFKKSLMAWDESSNKAHWKNRKEGQPFFSIFNIGVTHESQIWARAKDSLWVDENLDVPVPPYLPDTEIGRNDIRRMYSNIKMMDARVGELIKELEDEGILDETIIFWYTDHGGPLPRQKRLLYDSGIKVPLIVRFPDGKLASTRSNEMTSFIDLAPTILSLVGVQPFDYMDGKAFLGEHKNEEPAQYVFSAADRFDETYDKNRAVRDNRYKYIRYFEPEKSMFLHVNYRDQMPIMQELYRLRDEGKLTDTQKLWFRDQKPREELFDTKNDPHEIYNLADDLAFAEKKKELNAALEKWMDDVPDLNFEQESDYFKKLWPKGVQPVTANPKVSRKGVRVSVENQTEGASLGYQLLSDPLESLTNIWEVYTGPIEVPQGVTLKAIAHKVGFKPSEVVGEK